MSDDEQLDQEARALYEARYGEETAAYWEDFNELTRANWHAVAERARQLYASPAVIEPTHEPRAWLGFDGASVVRADETLIVGVSNDGMTEEEFAEFRAQWHATVGDRVHVVLIPNCTSMVIASPGEAVERRA